MQLNVTQKQRVADMAENLKTVAKPELWKNESGYTEKVRTLLLNIKNGLSAVGVNSIDLNKAIVCLDYARPDLSYKYLFENSNPDDQVCMHLDANYGKQLGKGCYINLLLLLTQ